MVKKNGHAMVGKVRRLVIPTNVLAGVSNQFPTLVSPSSKGLVNEGSLCYRNAVLQVLLHTPGVYRYLGKMHKNCNLRRDHCIVCALQALAYTYWNHTNLSASAVGRVPGPLLCLRGFHNACKTELPEGAIFMELCHDIDQGTMGDASEFLQYLLGHVRDKALDTDGATFSRMFDINLEQSYTCGDCGQQRRWKLDPPVGVGLDVGIAEPRRGLSLVQYLNQRTFAQVLPLYCDSSAACIAKYPKRGRVNQDGPKRQMSIQLIDPLPQVLVIRLKRFATETRTDRRTGKSMSVGVKLNDEVHFEEYLDLMEFTTRNQRGLYRLDGVVAHVGTGLDDGHYIAAMRTSNGRSFAVANDDHSVGPSSGGGRFAEMQSPSIGTCKGAPYVLVYSKVARK